ncbi:MAG: ATP-binding protein [Promethearchaeota archaeon]
MSTLIDSISIILIVVLIVYSVIFYYTRKRGGSRTLSKLFFICLLGTEILIFTLSSLPYLTINPDSATFPIKGIFSNIFFFSLLFSAGMFICSSFHYESDIVKLDKPSLLQSRKGKVKAGTIIENGRTKRPFYLSLEDLEKHMFICGATGTGKSNFLQHFLINLIRRYKIPFMLAEFKGEYHFLQRKIEDLLVIRPGENFSINIFNPGTSPPEIHAERIFDILKSGKFLDTTEEYSAQMQKVLVDILTKVCQKKQFQSWEGFYKYCNGYAINKKKEIPMLSQTIISITNRIRRFSLGPLKVLFDTEHKIKTDTLFSRNILIDLSSIIRLGGEKEDALFFLNMLLKYLWDRNLTRGAYNFQGIKHITIVEDTQYFAPKDLTRKSKLTTYLEDIALLQRGTGECLISLATHPDISEEILANCGVLICFKTHMDKEFLCKLLNLDIEHEDYLSILKKGQCIARVNSIERPFLLKVPHIPREWLKITEINKNNERVLKKFDQLKNKSVEIKNTKQTHNFRNFIEKFTGFLKKIKIKDGEKNNKINKNKAKSNEILNGDEYLDNYSSEYEVNDDISESSVDPEEAYENLKNYLDELYVKQQKRK